MQNPKKIQEKSGKIYDRRQHETTAIHTHTR
jgi:hypothetical protein